MTVAIVAGAVIGLALGIATEVPLMPELGLVLGGLTGWLAGRRRAE